MQPLLDHDARMQESGLVPADLHKMGGIEVLQDALGDHNSRQLRAAAANALAVAASNNAEFQERLWQKGGQAVVKQVLQVRLLFPGRGPEHGTRF